MLSGALHIKRGGVDDPVGLCQLQQKGGFLFGLARRDGPAVEVGPDGDPLRGGALHVSCEIRIGREAVARADHCKADAAGFYARPVDFSLPDGDVDSIYSSH